MNTEGSSDFPDEKAEEFRTIIRTYYSNFFKENGKINSNELDDFVQGALLKIIKGWSSVKSDENLIAWVKEISKNHLIDKWRKNKNYHFINMGQDADYFCAVSKSSCNKQKNTMDHELQNIVIERLGQKGKYKEREFFILLVEHITVGKVNFAKRLNIKQSTVRKRRERMRKAVIKILEELKDEL